MRKRPNIKPTNLLAKLCHVILDENSSQQSMHAALDDFAALCSQETNIQPNPTFSAWAEDTFLEQGLAINPQAAAFCIKDYQRSIIFIRAVYAAINDTLCAKKSRPINILYAGCGPFATLLLPILGKFKEDEIKLCQFNFFLLDIHQASLDSVALLLNFFNLSDNSINLVQADACTYQHPNLLNLIIAETMQKSLEQEPQFAVTANLAPQLTNDGIFIPEKIVVSLCLARLENERSLIEENAKIDNAAALEAALRIPLGTVLTLQPRLSAFQLKLAKIHPKTNKLALNDIQINIPNAPNLKNLDTLFLTYIQAYKSHELNDYDSELTLPLKCQTLTDLKPHTYFNISYQLGTYPEFYVSQSK